MKMTIVSKKALVEDSDAEISVVKKAAQQAAREVTFFLIVFCPLYENQLRREMN